MFKFMCLFALVAVSCAASIGRVDSTTEKREIVPVVKFETDKKPDGSFSFSYEGGDQSFRQETGVVENAGTDDEALEVSGSYRYIDADGQTVEVHYTAGRNGFVPVGSNILPEITALARAAADLPDTTADEENQRRRARSKDLKPESENKSEKSKKKLEKVVEKVEKTVEKTSEKPQKLEKVEKIEAPKKLEKVEKIEKIEAPKKQEKTETKVAEEKPKSEEKKIDTASKA